MLTTETRDQLEKLSGILLELESNDEIGDNLKEQIETLNADVNTELGY